MYAETYMPAHTYTRLTTPASMVPGHLTIVGDRTPPSYRERLWPGTHDTHNTHAVLSFNLVLVASVSEMMW